MCRCGGGLGAVSLFWMFLSQGAPSLVRLGQGVSWPAKADFHETMGSP